jgi:hypothetical protein
MQRSESGYSTQTVISSVLIVLVSFFYIFTVGTFLEVGIFPFEERATIHKSFHNYVFNQYVDSLIITISTLAWITTSIFGKARILSLLIYGTISLAAFGTNVQSLLVMITFSSLPMIVGFLILNIFSILKISAQYNLTLAFFAIFGIVLGVFSLLTSSLTLFSITLDLTDYAFQIFILISVLSPALLVFLVAGSPVKLVVMRSFNKFIFKNIKSELTSHILNSKTKIIYLISFMLISIILVLIPHYPVVNSENDLIGSDSADYNKWMNILRSSDSTEFFNQLFFLESSGDRPIPLLLFFPIVELFDSSSAQTIDYLPIILAPILVFTVFFLTRELTSNDISALFASFLTAISFHTLIGVYAGIYANWVAIIIGYSAFIFLLKFLKIPSRRNYIIFSILLFLLLFSHVYTWTVLTFFMFIFLGVAYKLKFLETKKIVLIALILITSVVVDLGKSFLTDSIGGIEQDVSMASTMISTENAFELGKNLIESIHLFAGGQFGNILILSLCVCWLLMSKLYSIPNIFVGVFFSIVLLPILFGEDIIQTRILYNIPFQIPAAISLTFFINRPYGKLIILSTCILIFAMSVKSLINFV